MYMEHAKSNVERGREVMGELAELLWRLRGLSGDRDLEAFFDRTKDAGGLLQESSAILDDPEFLDRLRAGYDGAPGNAIGESQ
jgi:hypothetical protein